MKMKLASIFILLFSLFFLVQCKKDDGYKSDLPEDNSSSDSTKDSGQEGRYDEMRFPIDIPLLFHGGSGRRPWNKKDIKSYIYTKKDGKIQWLFDGFLFLEITTNYYGTEYYFDGNPESGGIMMAPKKVWKELLTKTFYNGHGPGGLNDVLKDLADDGIYPPYKRKVVIALPYPDKDVDTWGELNGEKLDFHNDFARVQAVMWYIDEVLNAWKARRYKYIDLAGFYWIYEKAWSPYDRENLIPKVKQYIKTINIEDGTHYDFYWIPYNSKTGHASDWKSLGFDIGYYQPNYFFNTEYPYSKLTGALDFAKMYDMGLEMEFDGRLYGDGTKEDYLPRFYSYLRAFGDAGVWDNKRVSYYEGNGAWDAMVKSEDPDVIKATDSLESILIERKNNYKHFK